MRPGLDRDGYQSLLMQFYGYVAPWEQRVRAAISGNEALESLFAGRFKSAWLEQDLRHFGIQPRDVINSMATPILPDLSTTPRLLGSAYVMEGSSLGARFIASHIRECLGETHRTPCTYFSGYGSQTGSMWNRFLDAVCTMVPDNRENEALNASASTFQSLADWFSLAAMPHTGMVEHV